MKNEKGITVYVFSDNKKKKYFFSKKKIKFLKYLLYSGIILLVISIGVNVFFFSKLDQYLYMKNTINSHNLFFRNAINKLSEDRKNISTVIKQIWKFSLSHEQNPWEGGDPEPVTGKDLFSLMNYSVHQISGEVKNLQKVTSDLYRIFSSPESPYQWIPNYYPVTGEVVAPFGDYKDPFTQKVEHHTGVSIIAPFGSPVRAAAAGKIVYIGKDPRYGRIVKISHGYGLQTVYGHLGWIKFREGYYVKKGEVFAITGNTGRLIEPVLYFEVDFNGKPYDPSAFLIGGK